MSYDEFDRVLAEPDPLRQARAATELMALYQQRGVELARLRKEAITRAADEHGMTLTAVAAELGLSKGRITQIRQTAPGPERAVFGVGPLTLAIPLRAMPDRPTGVIAAEDGNAAQQMTELLTRLQFQVHAFQIPTTGEWDPPKDAVAICGPKSSHVTADAIASDPYLTFTDGGTGQWTIRDRESAEVLESPMDTGKTDSDVAYVGRLTYESGRLFVIAGLHSLGSLGAVAYLAENLPAIYAEVGVANFSMVVRSSFADGAPTHVEAIYPPRVHT